MPKTYLPTNVGFILNDLRMSKKKTQYQVAKELNISRELIDAIENMRTNPSLHSFVKIMDYFNCEISIVDKRTQKTVTNLKLIE